MKEVQFEKFSQDTQLLRRLLDTGDAKLVEVSRIVLVFALLVFISPLFRRAKMTSGELGVQEGVKMSWGKS